MEIFDRVKAILFNPKEEWTVIEAENEPHANVLTKYLLILALIPTLAFFAGEYLDNHSRYNEYIEDGTVKIEKSYNSRYSGNLEFSAERRTEMTKAIAEFEEKAKEQYRNANPFGTTKWNIIFAVCLFGIIVGSAYISAAIINALSDQFGSEKDFNRAFSLVAYSCTPLCVAGVLYIFHSFSWLVPYIGAYGLYLLYLGIEPQLKPETDKKASCAIISLIVVIAVLGFLARVAVPEIQKKMMTEEYVSIAKGTDKTGIPINIDAQMRKTFEKQAKYELENHKY